MIWHDARVACEKEDARLASIHSPGENTYVGLKLKKLGINLGWIGLHDLNAEDTFEWDDSSPADFFNWAKGGKPQNFIKHFLSIRTPRKHNIGWKNHDL